MKPLTTIPVLLPVLSGLALCFGVHLVHALQQPPPSHAENLYLSSFSDIEEGLIPSVSIGTADRDLKKIHTKLYAEKGKYPWYSLLLELIDHRYYWTGCSGSLVSPDFILTSANCVEEGLSAIWVGALTSEPVNGGQSDELIQIEEVFVHPGFDNKTFDSDFALIQLTEHSTIDPVRLGSSYQIATNESLVSFGSNKCSHDWTKRRDFLRLIETELKIIDNEECMSHPYAYEEGTITRNMICGVEEEKGNCPYYAGGGLYDANNEELVGFVSWDVNLWSWTGLPDIAVPQFPTVFSSIPNQISWIRATICSHSNDASICNTSAPSPSPLTNVALGKPTYQSGTMFNGESSRAVDGNTDGRWTSNSVTHTSKMRKPTWSVDLMYKYYIKKIKIYNRIDCCSSRLSGFKVTIKDDGKKVWEYTDEQEIPGDIRVISVPRSTIGTEVTISIPGADKILSLAEVKVIGKLVPYVTKTPSATPSIAFTTDPSTATIAPSSHTTSSPSACPSVKISVTTDEYQEETSWTLKSSSGEVWRSEPFLKDNTNYVSDICIIQSNCYTFTIKDLAGDGIDSPGGFFVSLSKEGVIFRDNIKIFRKRSIDFGSGCVDNSPSSFPTSSPTSSPSTASTKYCGNDQIEFFLSLTTDGAAGETSWSLTSGNDMIRESGRLVKKKTYEDLMCLYPSKCYNFTIMDSYGDGLDDGGDFEVLVDGSVLLKNPDQDFESLSEEFGLCSPPNHPSSLITIESNKNDGYCLEISSSRQNITLSECEKGTERNSTLWNAIHVEGRSTLLLQSVSSDECLAPTVKKNKNPQYNNGTKLATKPCNDHDESQKWNFRNGGEVRAFGNRKFCIDGNGPGKEVYLWECDDSSDQYWRWNNYSHPEG